MTEFLEEQLDLTQNRITELEKEICVLQDSVASLSEHLRDTQRYIIKMAKNHAEITKRISQWPYIAVSDTRGDEL